MTTRNNQDDIVETIKSQLDIIDVISKYTCLLYTSPSPRDQRGSRMPACA